MASPKKDQAATEGAAWPLGLSALAANVQELSQNRPAMQAQNPGAVAAMRRELSLEFLHECCGGIRIYAELVQTFAEVGDISGACYALRRLFSHAKAAHPVYVELRDGLASIEERAP